MIVLHPHVLSYIKRTGCHPRLGERKCKVTKRWLHSSFSCIWVLQVF